MNKVNLKLTLKKEYTFFSGWVLNFESNMKGIFKQLYIQYTIPHDLDKVNCIV